MERGWSSGNWRDELWKVKSKHAKSDIEDPHVFTVVASLECSALDTKYFAQRWIYMLLPPGIIVIIMVSKGGFWI